MGLIVWLVCALAPAAAAAENDQVTVPPVEQPKPPPPPPKPGPGASTLEARDPRAAPTMEVAGFTLRGTQQWHLLRLADLDVIVTPTGERFLPLLRLLRAFQVEKTEDGDLVSFQAEGGPKVVLDVRGRLIRMNDAESAVGIIVAISDITRQRDVYLPSKIMAEILGIELEWNEDQYEFRARTDRKLKIWALGVISMADIQAEDEEARLPERFPSARPARNSLYFMELEGYAENSIMNNRESGKQFAFQNLRQTFWGDLGGGRFKVRLAEPSLLFDHGELRNVNTPPVQVDWGEWVYRFRQNEVAVGDTSFGVSDLVFPMVKMTGVRVSGLAGGPPYDVGEEGPSPGLRAGSAQPYEFDGSALAGSKVQLFINDRLVQETTVVADSASRPGMGTYRFEDIHLAPGNLNDIRIVVTDPSGVVTQIRKRILPTSILLPQGRTLYLAAVGTNRVPDVYQTKGTIETGRVLYGVTDRLMVGTSFARQEDFFSILLRGTQPSGQAQFPQISTHLGGQVNWKPVDAFLLSGQAAISQKSASESLQTPSASNLGQTAFSQQGNPEGGRTDSALNLRTDLFPVRNLTLGAGVFRYGPEFFNGQNPLLCDRQGFSANATWQMNAKWAIAAALGEVGNDVDGQLPDRLRVDFRHVELTSSALPRTNVTLGYDEVTPDSTGVTQPLYSVRVRSQLPWQTTFVGEGWIGKPLDIKGQPDFFSGLALPGLELYQSPAGAGSLVTSIGHGQTIGPQFRQDGDRQRLSVVHTLRTPSPCVFQTRTEIGMDIYRRDTATRDGPHHCFFEQSLDFLFDVTGRNRVGILSRLELEQWYSIIYVNIAALYAFCDQAPVPIDEVRIDPERGAVGGLVFVDYNTNGIPDPGEPGLEGIKVVLNRVHTCVTDRNGHFVLPGIVASSEARVSLSMDSVPATYVPTIGTQKTVVHPRRLTQVNLGLAPAVSLAGKIQMPGMDDQMRGVPGIRITLVTRDKGALVADSVTATDGTFYIGDLLPGRYVLRVDTELLPRGIAMADTEWNLEIEPQREPQDLQLGIFYAYPES